MRILRFALVVDDTGGDVQQPVTQGVGSALADQVAEQTQRHNARSRLES
jgi:hypothetical protein